jgi:hypothetical protein
MMYNELTRSYNFLFSYYTTISPNPKVLELCGAHHQDRPYSNTFDDNLTCIINAYARPEYLPLIWEGVQYQTRRPRTTWIIQNNPGDQACVPRAFLERMRDRKDTIVVDSGINHGCWFRFLLAAIYCRTKYLVVLDDDTLPGRLAFEAAITDLVEQPGVYGGRGIILKSLPEGPRYWQHEIYGWPAASEERIEVDIAQQMWVIETWWLKELFKYLPDRMFDVSAPGRECGEEMYVSYVAQKAGLRTYVYRHGLVYNARWSSLQAYEMGNDSVAMHMTGGLNQVDYYLAQFVKDKWKLLRYR